MTSLTLTADQTSLVTTIARYIRDITDKELLELREAFNSAQKAVLNKPAHYGMQFGDFTATFQPGKTAATVHVGLVLETNSRSEIIIPEEALFAYNPEQAPPFLEAVLAYLSGLYRTIPKK